MKVLYFEQRDITDTDLVWGFLEAGYDLRIPEFRVPDAEYTEDELAAVLGEIGREEKEARTDLVATKDFSAVTAEACHRLGISYLSWVHDSPQRALWLKEALYETNLVFVFDRAQWGRLRERGIPHVYHQPLASNVTRLSMPEIAEADASPYRAELSFVGNLYTDERRSRFLATLPGPAREEVESLLSGEDGFRGESHALFRLLSAQTLDEIRSRYDTTGLEAYDIDFSYLVQATLLAREAAMRERIRILDALSAVCGVRLYTSGPEEAKKKLPRVAVSGKVDHDTQMPLVFRASKINLNLTIPSIETGVPLRIFEIMGAGGFVLSDDREEIGELFVRDEEIVTFSDPEECKEKALYYLSHDDVRERIAKKGLQKVSEHYTCPQAVERMLRTAFASGVLAGKEDR